MAAISLQSPLASFIPVFSLPTEVGWDSDWFLNYINFKHCQAQGSGQTLGRGSPAFQYLLQNLKPIPEILQPQDTPIKLLHPFFATCRTPGTSFPTASSHMWAPTQSLCLSGILLCPPCLPQHPFLAPIPQQLHLCCACSLPSKVLFPPVSPCTRASLRAWHIDFPIRLVQGAH